MSVSLKRRELPGSICGAVEAVQQEVHLAEQKRQGLGLAAKKTFLLQDRAVGHCLHLFRQMIIRFDEESSCEVVRMTGERVSTS